MNCPKRIAAFGLNGLLKRDCTLTRSGSLCDDPGGRRATASGRAFADISAPRLVLGVLRLRFTVQFQALIARMCGEWLSWLSPNWRARGNETVNVYKIKIYLFRAEEPSHRGCVEHPVSGETGRHSLIASYPLPTHRLRSNVVPQAAACR